MRTLETGTRYGKREEEPRKKEREEDNRYGERIGFPKVGLFSKVNKRLVHGDVA